MPQEPQPAASAGTAPTPDQRSPGTPGPASPLPVGTAADDAGRATRERPSLVARARSLWCAFVSGLG